MFLIYVFFLFFVYVLLEQNLGWYSELYLILMIDIKDSYEKALFLFYCVLLYSSTPSTQLNKYKCFFNIYLSLIDNTNYFKCCLKLRSELPFFFLCH